MMWPQYCSYRNCITPQLHCYSKSQKSPWHNSDMAASKLQWAAMKCARILMFVVSSSKSHYLVSYCHAC